MASPDFTGTLNDKKLSESPAITSRTIQIEVTGKIKKYKAQKENKLAEGWLKKR